MYSGYTIYYCYECGWKYKGVRYAYTCCPTCGSLLDIKTLNNILRGKNERKKAK